MCRWLAYTGSPVLLTDVLYTPVHSLIDQSLHSKLGAETTNGDGFGVGWYDATPAPGLFRSIEPAWNDQNLRELAGHVRSQAFFAHIRAPIGSAVQQTNCHPFRYGRWLWMHNGFIDGFAVVKRDLVLAVDESLFAEIKGQADSEVLFYLALSFGLEDDPPGRLRVLSGSWRPAGGGAASSTRSRARSPPAMVSACGHSATPARASRGRCLSPAMSASCGSSTRTGRSCARCPTTPGWWCQSPSVICPAPGPRCPRRATWWPAGGTTSSSPSSRNPRHRPGKSPAASPHRCGRASLPLQATARFPGGACPPATIQRGSACQRGSSLPTRAASPQPKWFHQALLGTWEGRDLGL
jgi:predicted glutamine amidotransferase